MEQVKHMYAKPTILKVQLNHEQAVLSACNTAATTMQGGGANFCGIPRSGIGCRKCPALCAPSRSSNSTSAS